MEALAGLRRARDPAWSSDVYVASEDTLALVQALERLNGVYGLAGEVGCGAGLVTEFLASLAEEVVSTDVVYRAVRETWARVKRRGLDAKVHVVCCDRLEALRTGGLFHLVAFNPPYLPAGDGDPTYDGGPSGVEVPLSFFESAAGRLAEGGLIVFVLSSLSDWTRALRAIAAKGFLTSILCRKGVGLFEDLMVILCKPKPRRD